MLTIKKKYLQNIESRMKVEQWSNNISNSSSIWQKSACGLRPYSSFFIYRLKGLIYNILLPFYCNFPGISLLFLFCFETFILWPNFHTKSSGFKVRILSNQWIFFSIVHASYSSFTIFSFYHAPKRKRCTTFFMTNIMSLLGRWDYMDLVKLILSIKYCRLKN